MFQMLGWHLDGRPLAYDTAEGRFCLFDAPVDREQVVEYSESGQFRWCSDGHKELAYEWMSGCGPTTKAELKATFKRLKDKLQTARIGIDEAPCLAELASIALPDDGGEAMICPTCHKDYDANYPHCPNCAAARATNGKVGSVSGLKPAPRKMNMWGFPKSTPKTKEYKRTCTKCGNVWYVPKGVAKEKGPNGMQMTGSTLMSIGSMGLAGGYRAGLEAQKSRVQANSRCSNCGSSSYSESKDW